MPDQSHLDNRYFVDTTIYNCPFCNRRHVSYSVVQSVKFDWTDKKRCFGYFVQCHSCGNRQRPKRSCSSFASFGAPGQAWLIL